MRKMTGWIDSYGMDGQLGVRAPKGSYSAPEKGALLVRAGRERLPRLAMVGAMDSVQVL